ncbi:hypothetical protein conserved [Leishmania donovani]|nr:hypothetical protein conserved [Leishmania donovani]VDZ46115.1 hypothetical_protein_conserved [Leishmania donovani]
MRSGVPLTDDDRAPWLRRLQKGVLAPCQGLGTASMVLPCSALRRCYRDALRGMDYCKNSKAAANTLQHTDAFFLLLSGDVKLIEERLQARQGHFMSTSLHGSQTATSEALKPTELGSTVDLDDPPSLIATEAAELIRIATTSSLRISPQPPPTDAWPGQRMLQPLSL